MTDATDVGTAGGGGKGAVNEGAATKEVVELDDGVVCNALGPAIVVTGDGTLVDANDDGCGHDDGGIRPGILVGYERLEPEYKLAAELAIGS